MTAPQTRIPVRVFDYGVEEPEEEEETRENYYNSDEDSAAVVKPLLIRDPVPDDAGTSKHYPTNVGPWRPIGSDVVNGTSQSPMRPSPTMRDKTVCSDSGTYVSDSVMTALLGGSPQRHLPNDVHCQIKAPLAYGTNVSTPQRHSILRVSADHIDNGRYGLRKSASVDFVLDRDLEQSVPTMHANMSFVGREPRRLTFQEKAELYRVRPDLEIGLAPFYSEDADEVHRRNQRRIIFSVFGGMISIIILLVFVSMWDENK